MGFRWVFLKSRLRRAAQGQSVSADSPAVPRHISTQAETIPRKKKHVKNYFSTIDFCFMGFTTSRLGRLCSMALGTPVFNFPVFSCKNRQRGLRNTPHKHPSRDMLPPSKKHVKQYFSTIYFCSGHVTAGTLMRDGPGHPCVWLALGTFNGGTLDRSWPPGQPLDRSWPPGQPLGMSWIPEQSLERS